MCACSALAGEARRQHVLGLGPLGGGLTLGETLHAVIADNLSSYSPTGNHAGGFGSMPPPCSVAAATGASGAHRRKEPSISGAGALPVPPASGTPNGSSSSNNNSGIRALSALNYE